MRSDVERVWLHNAQSVDSHENANVCLNLLPYMEIECNTKSHTHNAARIVTLCGDRVREQARPCVHVLILDKQKIK